ncbi:MAG: hypothetical protein ACI8W1_001610, partial [Candidatus Azotimanducaceae bacterium]
RASNKKPKIQPPRVNIMPIFLLECSILFSNN